MATAVMPQREIIRFEPGKPETVRLKYSTGREISGQYGPQVMFTTADGRIFFVDPPVARMIADAGIGADEPFRLGKTRKAKGGFDWVIERQGEDRGVYRPAESTRSGNNEHNHLAELEYEQEAERQRREFGRNARQTPPPPDDLEAKLTASIAQAQGARNGAAPDAVTPLAAKLCGTMCSLIDAMSEAKTYAARRRIDLTNEDLRALVATAFIQDCKGGAR